MPTVTLIGPLFASSSPAQVIEEAMHNAVQEVMLRGEALVKDQLYIGHGVRTGHYRRSIHGEMRGTFEGLIHDSNVIYGPWLEGTSSRNETTRFKGYAMFRNAAQQLQREAVDIGNKWAARAAARLS